MSAPSTTGSEPPIGAWVRLDPAPDVAVVGYTYLDPQAGFSAQGWQVTTEGLDQSSRVIVRLAGLAFPWRALTGDEIRGFALETPPSWVAEFYGPQPAAGTKFGAWRDHPKLKGRFLPDYPDDLQVFVHDGGPRVSKNPPEAVWVSVTGVDGDVFRGRVLNQPHNLKSVRQGSAIQFVVADGAPFPVMVTEKYLRERGDWDIVPCQGCGFAELFDAPTDLIRAVFPNQPEGGVMQMFTAFCPLCRGVQVVKSRDVSEGEEEPAGNPKPAEAVRPRTSAPARRPWWKFWA